MMQQQKGFGLVLLLTLLVAVGGISLAGKSVGLRSSLSTSSAILINAELEQARQALLSYSAHYPYLYGPKGAGVGHLPCPDTDALQLRVIDWAINQGPNPPCGSSLVAMGHLPSHISFPDGRYMIHAGFGSRVEYGVSEHVVNNPAKHAVNPESLSESPTEFIHPVLLRQRALGISLNSASSSELMLTKNALMLAVRPAVAAWVTGKINDQEASVCLLNQESLSEENLNVIDHRCHLLQELIFRCRSEERLLNLELEELLPATWDGTSEKFLSNLRLLFLADEIPEGFQCAANALEQIYIDTVPAKQHWFVRNGWINWIRIEHDAQCIQNLSEACRLTYINLREQEKLLEPLLLRWVLI